MKEIFAKRVAELLHKIPVLTAESIAEALLSSGIVSDERARQYCAVCEFYDRLNTDKKTVIVSELAEKYGISERTIASITAERRYRP